MCESLSKWYKRACKAAVEVEVVVVAVVVVVAADVVVVVVVAVVMVVVVVAAAAAAVVVCVVWLLGFVSRRRGPRLAPSPCVDPC